MDRSQSKALDAPDTECSENSQQCLSDLLEEVLLVASNIELLFTRMCSPNPPQLATLASSYRITRQRVGQIVKRDAERVFKQIHNDKFQPLREARIMFRQSAGTAVPLNSKFVTRWKHRTGSERSFEIFRWLAGYEYEDGWLLKGGRPVWKMLQYAIHPNTVPTANHEWLVQKDTLIANLNLPSSMRLRRDAALQLIRESKAWRGIGEGWIVRWDGTFFDKAERVLRLMGEPLLSDEIIDHVGYGSKSHLRSEYSPRFARVDKQSRLALPEWNYREYKGIVAEIEEQIEKGGGVAYLSTMQDEFASAFGVCKESVRIYVDYYGGYERLGDDVFRSSVPSEYSPNDPSTCEHSIKIGELWGQQFFVQEYHQKGGSFQLYKDIAVHNGIGTGDRLLVPVTHDGEWLGDASLIWRPQDIRTTIDVGKLRTILMKLGIGRGDGIVIVPTPDSCVLLYSDEAVERSVVSVSSRPAHDDSTI